MPRRWGVRGRGGRCERVGQRVDDDVANLGRPQGNIGDQNYEIPADADPAAYASVVIWCDRFDTAFGAADLTLTPGAIS